MKCIYCGCEDSKVLDSRSTDETNSIRRRRECLSCGRRYTTYETVETTPILVIKNDGSRQPFDPSKIKSGLIKACEKRPVSMSQIENVVSVAGVERGACICGSGPGQPVILPEDVAGVGLLGQCVHS